MHTLNDLSVSIGTWRRSKGFFTPNVNIMANPAAADLTNGDAMLGKLMLVVTEVAEAAEAVRHNDIENFEEELADIFIRLLDICDASRVDIDKAIAKKMEANKLRPIKHGKATNL